MYSDPDRHFYLHVRDHVTDETIMWSHKAVWVSLTLSPCSVRDPETVTHWKSELNLTGRLWWVWVHVCTAGIHTPCSITAAAYKSCFSFTLDVRPLITRSQPQTLWWSGQDPARAVNVCVCEWVTKTLYKIWYRSVLMTVHGIQTVTCRHFWGNSNYSCDATFTLVWPRGYFSSLNTNLLAGGLTALEIKHHIKRCLRYFKWVTVKKNVTRLKKKEKKKKGKENAPLS